MSLNLLQLKDLVVKPVLKDLGMYSIASLGAIYQMDSNTLNRLSNWLGEQLPNWMSEDKTSQPIANSSTNGPANQLVQQQGNTKQASVSFAPVINLTPTGNPSYDQELSDQIIQRLKVELTPTLMGGSAVAMSADAILSDSQAINA